MRVLVLLAALAWSAAAAAGPVIDRALDAHVLPRIDRLAAAGADLAAAAAEDCRPRARALRDAYHAAYDAWAGVSHLRFGPMETESRGFALAFWPDTRGSTARTLAGLIAEKDPVVDDPAAFATVSVAGRGLLALERLLYDARFAGGGGTGYHCRLVRAVARDIGRTAAAVRAGWDGHALRMRRAGAADTVLYRSPTEALRTLFTAVDTGLEFNAELRLGRPMGSFDRPRPGRAEARRSGRSLRNLRLSLAAVGELAGILAARAAPADRAAIAQAFARADRTAAALDDPVFAAVATPQGRVRVEALQQRVRDAREAVATRLGPSLGVAAGFNALDGD
jgi:hypothetical protein